MISARVLLHVENYCYEVIDYYENLDNYKFSEGYYECAQQIIALIDEKRRITNCQDSYIDIKEVKGDIKEVKGQTKWIIQH